MLKRLTTEWHARGHIITLWTQCSIIFQWSGSPPGAKPKMDEMIAMKLVDQSLKLV